MNKKILYFAGLAWMCISICKADDMKVKLNSTDGSTSFQVRNSNDVVVSTITSTGDAIFNSATLGGDLRVKGNDIFFGASQTERKIYDDPANFVIGLSTNFYVAGRLHIAGSFRLGLSATAGYVLTTDASGVGTWQAATGGGGTTLPIDTKGDGNVITSTGDVSVQIDTDNNENKAFVVRASTGNSIFAVIERSGVAGAGELHLGDYNRRIYDDPANNVIGFSSSVYVNGRIHSTFFRLGTSATAGYVLTTDASGVGTWQAAPGAGGGISGSGTAGTMPRFTGSATLGDSSIDDDGTNAIATGNLTVQGRGITTGNPTGTGVSQGTVYINPGSATSDQTLLGIAVGGVERMRFSREGNLFLYSQIFPGSTLGGPQTARYLADDPTNYVLKISTNLYVDGRVHSTSFRLGTSATAGYVLTTDASGIGTWQAATGGGGTTLPIDTKGDGNVITSTGDVSVQIDTDNNENKAFVVRASTGNAIFAVIERSGVGGAGELHLGNYNRRIYDDPLNNVLGLSSDLYVNGRVHAGTSFRLGTSATAGYVLTTDASGVGTWQAAPSGWTDGGTIVYPTSASDDVAIGGTTSAAPFYFDVSASSMSVAGLASIGGDVRSAGNIFAGSGKQLSFGLQTSDPSIDHNSGSYRIDITTNVKVGGYLMLASNDIRDSGGNTRISLATSATSTTTIKSNLDAQYNLIIGGSFRLGTSATAGYVLTTDATGIGTWQAAPGAGGGISGSGTSGTVPRFTGSATLGDSSIDDDGTNATMTGDIRVKGNDIFFGASQTDRKIYDDSTKFATRFSSNVYIDGSIIAQNVIVSVPLWTGAGGYTVSNGSDADLNSCQAAFIVDSFFPPGTPLQLRMVIHETTSGGGSYNLKTVDSAGTATNIIQNTDLAWDQSGSGVWYMVYSSWKDWTPTTNNWTFSLYGKDSDGVPNPVVSNCYVLVRAKK